MSSDLRKQKPRLLLFVGAGFSASAGAPVMAQFRDVARLLRLPEDVIRAVNAAYYFPDYSFGAQPNLETAYGSLVFWEILYGPAYRIATHSSTGAFICATHGPGVGAAREAFERAIATVYGQAVETRRADWIGLYSRFFRFLLDRFRVGILTTNYDRVVETTLAELQEVASYHLGPIRRTLAWNGEIPILKLHGSVNWDPDHVHTDPADIRPADAPVPRPFILAPTWNKDLKQNRAFAKVWRLAIDLIAQADAILVVGHSFPSSDTHLNLLLAHGLSAQEGSPSAKPVTIVDANRDTADAISSQFQHYQTVGRCTAWPCAFECFVNDLESGRLNLLGTAGATT